MKVMKTIKYLILAMFLITVGCSTETGAMEGDSLTQKDAIYYKQMNKVVDELDDVFGKLTQPVKEFSNDRNKYKEVTKPAEEARVSMIAIQKEVEKIKPPSGLESDHEHMLKTIESSKKGIDNLIRLSNDKSKATDEKLYKIYINDVIIDMQVTELENIAESIRSHKE
jgi:hypothetical protein